jgi:hypothetical protein
VTPVAGADNPDNGGGAQFAHFGARTTKGNRTQLPLITIVCIYWTFFGNLKLPIRYTRSMMARETHYSCDHFADGDSLWIVSRFILRTATELGG